MDQNTLFSGWLLWTPSVFSVRQYTKFDMLKAEFSFEFTLCTLELIFQVFPIVSGRYGWVQSNQNNVLLTNVHSVAFSWNQSVTKTFPCQKVGKRPKSSQTKAYEHWALSTTLLTFEWEWKWKWKNKHEYEWNWKQIKKIPCNSSPRLRELKAELSYR